MQISRNERKKTDMYDFAAALFVLLFACLIPSIFSVVCYVLESLGTYTIAKRRGIHNPWLAWIPVAQTWIFGSLSDQYRFVARDKVTNRRKILLALSIASAVIGGIALFRMLGVYFELVFSALDGRLDNITDETMLELIGVPILSFAGLSIVAWVLGVVQMVFAYIAFYDIFASCDPNNATIFLVLSILINATRPFFVFACRNKDLGMPPRKTDAVPPAPARIPEEPWENA